MYKKKASVFITVILLLSMVLTGCSTDTLGFLDLMQEIQTTASTKATKSVSKISISDIKIPDELFVDGEAQLFKTITTTLDDNYITITQKSDPTKNISSTSFDLVAKKGDKKDNLITLNYKDNAIAISVGTKLDEFYPGMSLAVAPINNKLIPFSTFEELLGDTPIALNSISNPKALEGVEKKSLDYLMDLKTMYKDLDTDLITKDGNAFVLKADINDSLVFLDKFVLASIKNFDKLMDSTIKFMDSLTDEEFNTIYANMFPEGKKAVVDMLKEAKAEFASESMAKEAADEWSATYPETSVLVKEMLEGTSLNLRTWKENDKYYTNTQTKIQIKDSFDSGLVFGTNVSVESQTETITEDFDITMPTEVINKEILENFLGYM